MKLKSLLQNFVQYKIIMYGEFKKNNRSEMEELFSLLETYLKKEISYIKIYGVSVPSTYTLYNFPYQKLEER